MSFFCVNITTQKKLIHSNIKNIIKNWMDKFHEVNQVEIAKKLAKKGIVSAQPPKKKQKKSRKKSRKQHSGKKWFLTFPQCLQSKELVLTRILFKFPNLKWVIVAHEKGKDGKNPHLHCVFWLKKMVRYRDPHFWDFVAQKHGNYQIPKDIVKVVKYVTKENNYVSHGIDVPTWLKSHQTKNGASFELVAKLMQEGKSLEALDDLHPGMVARNLQKLEKYQQFLQSKKRKAAAKELEIWKALDIGQMDLDFRELGLWMNKNLNGSLRPMKMKQLWLWGCTNLGKTTLVLNLMKTHRIYWVPMEVAHLDNYSDEDYDLIVLDEFKAQKSITWMNEFVQGTPKLVFRRYRSYLKTKNLPVIVLSNYSVEGAYSKVHMFNPERLNSIKGRFNVINIKKYVAKIIK